MDSRALRDFRLLLFFVALIWLIELVNLYLGHRLNTYGLIPRQAGQLYGIVTMHFLHGGLTHLIANSLPLIVLGFLVSATHKTVQVSVTIAILTGCLVWLIARPAIHVGASGLAMGYFGFLVSGAFFERSIKNIILLILTVVLYGGLVFSLIDFRNGVSFEAHLLGFISGIVSAKIWLRSNKTKTNKVTRE